MAISNLSLAVMEAHTGLLPACTPCASFAVPANAWLKLLAAPLAGRATATCPLPGLVLLTPPQNVSGGASLIIVTAPGRQEPCTSCCRRQH